MTQMEECLKQGKKIDKWLDYVISYFDANYDQFETTCRGGEKEKWYFRKTDVIFKVNAFSFPLCGFVTEFADSTNDLDLIQAEDGDQYPLLDYDTPEEMLRDMLKEIEG